MRMISMNYLYTLAFIKRKDEVLMLNRQKQPWQGIWNGVGGKRHDTECIVDAICREILEETQIEVSPALIKDKGVVTWNDAFEAASSGLHLFLVEMPDDFQFKTPIQTSEGILDWKKINWVSNKENLGVAYNIPYFLHNLIRDDKKYHYHCLFEGNILRKVAVKPI